MKRYWLFILILAAELVSAIIFCGNSLMSFVDIHSFIIVVVIPFLLVSILFSFKDTRRIFTIMRKNENEHDILLTSLVFFKDYSKATWLATIIAIFTGSIGIMRDLDDKASIGHCLALVIIGLFYCGVVQLAIIIPYTVSIN